MSTIRFLVEERNRTVIMRRVSSKVIGITMDVNLDKAVYTSGFYLLNENNFSVMGDYTAYVTEYRKVGDEIQLSCDGSKYVEPAKPTTTVVPVAVWDDANDADGVRPASINVTLYKGNEKIAICPLTKVNNWVNKIENLDATVTYTMKGEDVAGYTYTINNFSITYVHTSLNDTRARKTSEISVEGNRQTSLGVTVDGVAYPYDSALKSIYEMAAQTGSKIVYNGVTNTADSLADLYVKLEEKKLYNDKYVALMSDMILEMTDIDKINALQFGSELDDTRKSELTTYVDERNKILENYVAQLKYATVDEVSYVESAVTEIYELIASVEE